MNIAQTHWEWYWLIENVLHYKKKSTVFVVSSGVVLWEDAGTTFVYYSFLIFFIQKFCLDIILIIGTKFLIKKVKF